MHIFQINGNDGRTYTSPEENTTEFIGLYHPLLGGERRGHDIDLSQYRRWASHTVSYDEGRRLVRPVTREEVKLAFFDIAEDKSSGFDGYSTAFVKAAWPVVGDEVTRAVLDFFYNDCLLKQVNATLITLIPKVQAPASVSGFPPYRVAMCCIRQLQKS
ncbi:UNVERIFIED_CONTAM: hypothetical protein Sradi_7145800 [Sesamum radiatum]|uniref:Uncharacterized protein n=1 Tax=Sesamum radiatum TaxID=300843 RepID=A0AAW2IX84_SESRA